MEYTNIKVFEDIIHFTSDTKLHSEEILFIKKGNYIYKCKTSQSYKNPINLYDGYGVILEITEKEKTIEDCVIKNLQLEDTIIFKTNQYLPMIEIEEMQTHYSKKLGCQVIILPPTLEVVKFTRNIEIVEQKE
jgi:hypothetical protein